MVLLRYILSVGLLVLLLACSDRAGQSIVYQNERGHFLLLDSVYLVGEELRIPFVHEGHLTRPSLLVSNSQTDLLIAAEADSSVFVLTENHSNRAGIVLLSLLGQSRLLDERSIAFRPRQANGLIDLFTGPNTVMAGTGAPIMTVAILRDEFGNPVSEGTLVEYTNTSAVGIGEFLDTTKHLCSYQKFYGGELRDKHFIAVASGNAHSRQNEYRVESAWPANLQIQLEEFFPFADSRQVLWISTQPIFDSFGNEMPDGTLVDFEVWQEESQIAAYVSKTVNGIAKVRIQNPSTSCLWSINASCRNAVQSNVLHLEFDAIVDKIAVQFQEDSCQFLIGPVSSSLGQVVPDGFPIELRFVSRDFEYYQDLELLGGYCSYKLPREQFQPDKDYDCEVISGGVKRIIRFEL